MQGRIRQRPISVERPLPIVERPEDIPEMSVLAEPATDVAAAPPPPVTSLTPGSPGSSDPRSASPGACRASPTTAAAADQATLDIPIPSYVVDQAYGENFASFALPAAYLKRKEKCYEGVIDYDMDNEDVAWLAEVRSNQEGRAGTGYTDLNEETIERWMDAFEKEALRKDPPPAMHDEEIQIGFTGVNLEKKHRKLPGGASAHTPCCVCWRVGGGDKNELMFCGRCHMAVHRECYGVEREKKRGGGHRVQQRGGGYGSRTPWFCTRCELDVADARRAAAENPSGGAAASAASASAAAATTDTEQPPAQVVPGWGVGTGECCLCPVKGGALKPTDDSRWCHIICAIWVPEPCISNVASMQPVERIEKISNKRRRLECSVCLTSNRGACIQCSVAGCDRAFHAACAYTATPEYCLRAHLQPDRSAVQFEAFCSEHSRARMGGGGGHAESNAAASARARRAAAAANGGSAPAVASGLSAIAVDPEHDHLGHPIVCYTRPSSQQDAFWRPSALTSIPARAESYAVYNHWAAKRARRGGVLLWRTEEPLTAKPSSPRSGRRLKRSPEQLEQQYLRLHVLRQELERLRLLVDLVQKREILKREMWRTQQETHRIRDEKTDGEGKI